MHALPRLNRWLGRCLCGLDKTKNTYGPINTHSLIKADVNDNDRMF